VDHRDGRHHRRGALDWGTIMSLATMQSEAMRRSGAR
jgi:hypothetical protein